MSLLRAQEQIALRPVDEATALQLMKELNIPAGIARTLAARKLSSFDECKAFFRPDLTHFHDPFLFVAMERAVDRILAAIAKGEKIAVYGDYDVDGVTSTTLLMRVLHKLGADCSYFLPNRLIDGYGVSEAGVRTIARSGVSLIITVDCGVGAKKEVEVATCLGVDCIITDHHEVNDTLPAAYAILNPKVPGCSYPYKELAGVGVALKLCQALALKSGRGEALWLPYMDIVALGTAADIVKLVDENRIIVYYGFQMLTKTEHPGLRALIEQQGLSGKVLSTAQVVFQLTPSINAVGRLGDPRRAVELLLADDSSVAATAAAAMYAVNIERRQIDSVVAQEAHAWVAANTDQQHDVALVIGSDTWHSGVIGIVASKLVDRYFRPTILLSIGTDGYARGSGRSIPALNLVEALNGCADLLEGYGGHKAAAGLTIKTANIELFRKRFNEVVGHLLKPEDFIPVVLADAEVGIPNITPKFFRIIQQMGPFGPGNMRPVFLARNVKHHTTPRIVGKKHLKMSLSGDGINMDAIGFDLHDRYKEIKQAQSLAVAFTIDENEWKGKCSLQMKVKGITV